MGHFEKKVAVNQQPATNAWDNTAGREAPTTKDKRYT
jgi:hypothetical protein